MYFLCFVIIISYLWLIIFKVLLIGKEWGFKLWRQIES